VLKVLGRLKAALSVVGASSGRPDRVKLKAAIAARTHAEQMVIESRETVTRLQDVINQANDAARVAARATQTATEARRRWAIDGCPHSASGELQALDDAATEAAQVAARTAQDADVIAKTHTLANAQSVLQSAEIDLHSHEEKISAAAGAILADEAASMLERYERTADEYRTLRREVTVLFQLLDPPTPSFTSGWDPSGRDRKFRYRPTSSIDGARLVAAAMRHATFASWDKERGDARAHDFVHGPRGRDEEMLEQLASKWHERAKALRNDPDA
jgi:hypothetical protein